MWSFSNSSQSYQKVSVQTQKWLHKLGESYFHHTRYIDVAKPSDVLDLRTYWKIVSIRCSTIYFSSVWSHIFQAAGHILVCLFCTSATLFRYITLSAALPYSCNLTSLFRNPWYASILLELSCTSSLHDAFLFNLFQIVSMLKSSWWGSSTSFFVYRFTLLLHGFMLIASQSKTADIVLIYPLSSDRYDGADSDSMQIRTLSILRCCTTFRAFASRTTVDSPAPCLFSDIQTCLYDGTD